MADIAKFALELSDNLSGPSKQATASIEMLRTKLDDARSALDKYESKLRVANEIGNVSGHERYGAAVQAQTRHVADLTAALGEAQAPAGGLVSSLGGMAGAAGAAGIAVGAVAIAVRLTVGALEMMVDVTERLVIKALDVTNANDQMRASFDALGGTGAGAKTLEMIDGLSERLPQSREQLAKWTKQLQAMGVTDLSQVRAELVATASAQAIMGDEGANAYRKIQERVRLAVEEHHGLKLAEKSLKGLYEAGLNVTDIASRLGLTTQDLGAKLKSGTVDAQKFGDAMRDSLLEKGRGPLEAMSNSLGSIGAKAKEALGHLFDGIDGSPITDALRNLIALGDQGAPSGEALKMGLVPAMNAVISAIGRAITEAEVFFLELEVDALEAYIQLKPVIKAFNEIKDAAAPLTNLVSGVINAPRIVEAQGSKDEAAAQGGMLGKIMLAEFVGPSTGMVAAIHLALQEMAAAEAQGIAHSSGQAIGKAAVAGMRDGIGAHSPSIEAIKVGMDLSAGLGIGIEQSSMPERAVRTVSANTIAGLSGGASNQNGSAQGGNNVGAIHISIVAPNGVTDAQQLSITGLATALERMQLGAGR